ncbi:hypothetical protein FCM35_KLT06942 [Carex littledalei]|uniref:Uncharacterized protein n=1 Tax=Carex littledalei TaxID=544730 RepID=A0A833QUZ5_9POAL|nr:hypothetical protein FCM35_KLT06942 [Carex littledalei]
MARTIVGTSVSLIFIFTLILVALLSSRTVLLAEAGQNCICECMRVCRNKIIGREAQCAKACSKACIKAGFPAYPKDGIIYCAPSPPNST